MSKRHSPVCGWMLEKPAFRRTQLRIDPVSKYSLVLGQDLRLALCATGFASAVRR